jgi:gluconolactonase
MLDRLEPFAHGIRHAEGVAWNPFDERVYCGGEEGEVYAISLAGDVDLLGTTGGSMLGIAVDGHGRIYACDSGKGEVARLDPATGSFEVYARGVRGRGMDTPNVAAFAPDGMLYVTCSGEEGRPEILRIAPDRSVELWTDALPGYPNGCLVTPDAAALVIVEAKAERVVRVPITETGAAGSPSVLASLPDTDAEGIALDADGNYWATLYRPDAIVRISPDGAVDVVVDDHLATTLNAPTNIAWIGNGLDRAVVANVASTSLLVADLGVRGEPLHHPEVP